jgi:hypothetical protein
MLKTSMLDGARQREHAQTSTGRTTGAERQRVRVRILWLGLLTVALCAAFTAPAFAAGTTYSQTVNVPVPPASNYAGSGGGDGWSVALSNTQVFNVFHHQGSLQVACHNQSDASACWVDTITDAGGHNFGSAAHPGMYLDAKTGKLYVYATRDDSTGGVVCVDTTQGATNPDPFCGFTALTAVGESQYPGMSYLSNPVLIGNQLYAYNFFPGAAGAAGTNGDENAMLCFDVTTDAACSGQPFAVNIGSGTDSDGYFPSPAIAAFGNQIVVPTSLSGGSELACFDGSTHGNCTGSWPVSLSGTSYFPSNSGAPFPLLNASGQQQGFCLPDGTDECYKLDGSTTATPAGMGGVIGGSDGWNGPAVQIGPRVYVADGNANQVDCYDYAAQAGCQSFPKTFQNLGYLYTTNPDPQRPTCIWVNADYGSEQIQNFDAYSGGACGQGSIRVLASQFVVPQQQCYPTTYNTLQIVSPDPSTYQGGTVNVEDLSGNVVPGGANLPINNGSVDLSGVNPASTNGLPQFLIVLNGTSGNPQAVTVKLTWTATYDPSCSSGGQTVTPQDTTTTTSLSGGGQSGAKITVPAGTSVTDKASLSGQNAGAASGSVTYAWYSDSACTTAVGSPDKETINTPGTIPASQAVTFNTPGTYYAIASYSGDAGNNASAGKCGDETVTVPGATSSGPSIDGQPVNAQAITRARARVTAPAGDLLVAFIRTDSPSGAGNTATISGGGLTWTRAARENRSLGDAEVWSAKVPAGGLTNAAITARTVRFSGYDVALTIIAFKDASGIGATATGHGIGLPTVTLTTTQANSWVFAAGDDWDASINRTAGPGQTIEQQSTDSVGDTYWVQSTNAPTATAGTHVTINDTAPSRDRFDLAAVEILG